MLVTGDTNKRKMERTRKKKGKRHEKRNRAQTRNKPFKLGKKTNKALEKNKKQGSY